VTIFGILTKLLNVTFSIFTESPKSKITASELVSKISGQSN